MEVTAAQTALTSIKLFTSKAFGGVPICREGRKPGRKGF